jgi:hypothetical protein
MRKVLISLGLHHLLKDFPQIIVLVYFCPGEMKIIGNLARVDIAVHTMMLWDD